VSPNCIPNPNPPAVVEWLWRCWSKTRKGCPKHNVMLHLLPRTHESKCAFNLHKKKKKLRRIHKLHKLTIKPVETEHLQEKKPQNGWGKCTFLEHLLETGWPTDLEAVRRWGHLRNAAYTAIPVRSYSRSTRKSTNCIYPNDQIAKLHLKFLFFSVNAECFPQQQ